MDTHKLFSTKYRSKALVFLALCIIVMVAAVVLAAQVQRDFGNVAVSNVTFTNESGIEVRAKLLRPQNASAQNPAPGIVYIHGYQNNRETSDAYCIELARRGFVMLCIDAIGRGNSGVPLSLDDPDFDDTFGASASLAYLRDLPFVNPDAVGLMGHSIGAEIAYGLALQDSGVRALVISGFGYREDATPDLPHNMLMVFGKYDEYRKRMTGTRDFAAGWMGSPQTKAAIAESDPQFAVTYGDFDAGTARRVYMPAVTHIQESHNRGAIAEALVWMRTALDPPAESWIDATSQIWEIKEWATLVAMLACFAALLPLALLLLQSKFFAPLRGPAAGKYACPPKETLKHAAINGVLMLLYLPLILTIFGFHVYVLPIDKLFPMMLVNGIAFWFVVINLIGFFYLRGWFRKRAKRDGLTLTELGLSDQPEKFRLERHRLGRVVLLSLTLFAFAYACEHLLEALFIVDFRFIFPFASDLTPYRALMFAIYLPFFLLGFLQLGFFLHGQIRSAPKATWLGTLASWSGRNILVLVIPLLLLLAMQYIPIFTVGAIPFVGPAAALVGFMINLIHIIIVLLLVTPLSTWLYQLTGNVYAGALLNALLVTWMFASSQVIAPIPV